MLLELILDVRLEFGELRIRYNGLFRLCFHEIQCLGAISQDISQTFSDGRRTLTLAP